MSKWYGSLNNRLEENKMFVKEIKVGTGMTEYLYSDRIPYEVIEVEDQKHVKVRRMKHRRAPNAIDFSNDWELFSDENGYQMNLVKRGNYWYNKYTFTREMLTAGTEEEQIRAWNHVVMNGGDPNKVLEKGKMDKYFRVNVSFGVAEYHYDYSF